MLLVRPDVRMIFCQQLLFAVLHDQTGLFVATLSRVSWDGHSCVQLTRRASENDLVLFAKRIGDGGKPTFR